MRDTVPVNFNMIDEHYKMIGYNAAVTQNSKSKIVRILAGTGAKLVVVENHYNRKKNTSGRLACEKLQLLSITPEITPDNELVYGIQEVQRVEDMDGVINAKIKAGKHKVCVRLDFGFARYISWFQKYYDCTLDHVMTRLIQHGMALTLCSDSSKDYSEQDLKEFEKIKRYTVTYDLDGKDILLTEPAPNTQVDFNQFKKIPAGIQSSRSMDNNPTKTNQGNRKKEIVT